MMSKRSHMRKIIKRSSAAAAEEEALVAIFMLLLFHEKFHSAGRALLRRWQVSHFFLLYA
jgi:hypothetical protein